MIHSTALQESRGWLGCGPPDRGYHAAIMTSPFTCGAALVLLLASPGCVDDKDPGTTLMTTNVPVSDGSSATNATGASATSATSATTKTTTADTEGMSETGVPDVTSDTLVTANEADTGASESDGPTSSTTDGEASATTDPAAVDYEGEIQPIWDARCSCHTQGGAGGLSLAAGSSYDNLVLVPAVGGAQVRVFPGLPDESYVWRKLNDTHLEAGGSGLWMPLGGPPLPADDLDLIEAWILANAPP